MLTKNKKRPYCFAIRPFLSNLKRQPTQNALTSRSSSICLIPFTFNSSRFFSFPDEHPVITQEKVKTCLMVQPLLRRSCAMFSMRVASFSSTEAMKLMTFPFIRVPNQFCGLCTRPEPTSLAGRLSFLEFSVSKLQISAAVAAGFFSQYCAATPATKGVDMLVPFRLA